MLPWPKRPVIYEINTWVWLTQLSRRHGRAVTLATVPAAEWDAIAALGVDAVWLMGVWARSPAGIAIALGNAGLMAELRSALPDLATEDVVGSPYCVRRYEVDDHLGGRAGLAAARERLRRRGLRLILDFVPNHVAPDHPWVVERPTSFIRGSAEDLRREPGAFREVGDEVFACGRDPYLPAWPDVLQLNAFDPALREAVVEIVADIAGQCDGVRCDMAMLVLNGVFARTWGARAGEPPAAEYWRTLIPAIKAKRPDFLFIAEAYWDLEWELQQQGFDYCYDKRLYDQLVHGGPESVRLHLLAGSAYQERLVRFIENHDEPRAAVTFSRVRGRAAALALLTLPGARLLNEGQLEGRQVRLPLFLGRRPEEPVDEDLARFYARLLQATGHAALRGGRWSLCEQRGWPDNPSQKNLLAWCWIQDEARFLTVLNLAEQSAQGRVELPWDDLPGSAWRLVDVLSGETFERRGNELREEGLYVDLPGGGYHFLQVCATSRL